MPEHIDREYFLKNLEQHATIDGVGQIVRIEFFEEYEMGTNTTITYKNGNGESYDTRLS